MTAGNSSESATCSGRVGTTRATVRKTGSARAAPSWTQWTASEVYKLDSIMGQAQELGSYWINGLPLDAGEQLIARLRAVTPAQVQAVARRYFTDRTLNTGLLLPEAAEAAVAAAKEGAK